MNAEISNQHLVGGCVNYGFNFLDFGNCDTGHSYGNIGQITPYLSLNSFQYLLLKNFIANYQSENI